MMLKAIEYLINLFNSSNKEITQIILIILLKLALINLGHYFYHYSVIEKHN